MGYQKVVCDRQNLRPYCKQFPESNCENIPGQQCEQVPRQVCQNTCNQSSYCNMCSQFASQGGFQSQSCQTPTCSNFISSVAKTPFCLLEMLPQLSTNQLHLLRSITANTTV